MLVFLVAPRPLSDSSLAVVYLRAIRQIPAERARTGLRVGIFARPSSADLDLWCALDLGAADLV